MKSNDLNYQNKQEQTVDNQAWTKQLVEEAVTFVRLELYNRDLLCGPKAILKRLQDLYHIKPVPSERTIARILARHGLTHRRLVITNKRIFII